MHKGISKTLQNESITKYMLTFAAVHFKVAPFWVYATH